MPRGPTGPRGLTWVLEEVGRGRLNRGRPDPAGTFNSLIRIAGTIDASLAFEDAMTCLCAPVFLGASCDEERSFLRSALAAHPRFFTSHLPADDEATLRSWAEAMSGAAFSRRPVWLSEAAFECVDELRRCLPEARFVRVVHRPTSCVGGVLELDGEQLRVDPAGEMERVLAFLGETPVAALEQMRRCA